MVFSIIAAALSLGAFLWGLQHFSYLQLLGLFLLVVGFAYNAVRIYGKQVPERKSTVVKVYLWAVLFFYFFFLFSLTFNISRYSNGFVADMGELSERLRFNSNLVPFRTIRRMFTYDFPTSYVVVNIIGNIAALMPLGILLPLNFPAAKKFIPFTLMVAGVVVFIEVMQLLFGVGSLDIDDLILNVAGAVVVYWLRIYDLVKI